MVVNTRWNFLLMYLLLFIYTFKMSMLFFFHRCVPLPYKYRYVSYNGEKLIYAFIFSPTSLLKISTNLYISYDRKKFNCVLHMLCKFSIFFFFFFFLCLLSMPCQWSALYIKETKLIISFYLHQNKMWHHVLKCIFFIFSKQVWSISMVW